MQAILTSGAWGRAAPPPPAPRPPPGTFPPGLPSWLSRRRQTLLAITGDRRRGSFVLANGTAARERVSRTLGRTAGAGTPLAAPDSGACARPQLGPRGQAGAASDGPTGSGANPRRQATGERSLRAAATAGEPATGDAGAAAPREQVPNGNRNKSELRSGTKSVFSCRTLRSREDRCESARWAQGSGLAG